MAAALKRFLLLSQLRRAIQKVKFLLTFAAGRWVLSPTLAGSSPRPRRLISLGARPGLLDCAEEDFYHDAGAAFALSRTSSLANSEISRSPSPSPSPSPALTDMARTSSDTSSSSASDDIDRRADMFIEQFYRHIQMERQVSLQLRYCKENASFIERHRSD